MIIGYLCVGGVLRTIVRNRFLPFWCAKRTLRILLIPFRDINQIQPFKILFMTQAEQFEVENPESRLSCSACGFSTSKDYFAGQFKVQLQWYFPQHKLKLAMTGSGIL